METVRVLWAPVEVLQRTARERRVAPAVGVVGFLALLYLLTTVVRIVQGGVELPPEQAAGLTPDERRATVLAAAIITPAIAALLPFVLWLTASVLVHGASRMFGGRGPFRAILSVVGVAHMPLIAGAVVISVLTALLAMAGPETPAGGVMATLGFMAFLGQVTWFILLVIIGTGFAHDLTYGRATASCAVSAAGCVGLLALGGLALFGLLALLQVAA